MVPLVDLGVEHFMVVLVVGQEVGTVDHLVDMVARLLDQPAVHLMAGLMMRTAQLNMLCSVTLVSSI